MNSAFATFLIMLNEDGAKLRAENTDLCAQLAETRADAEAYRRHYLSEQSDLIAVRAQLAAAQDEIAIQRHEREVIVTTCDEQTAQLAKVTGLLRDLAEATKPMREQVLRAIQDPSATITFPRLDAAHDAAHDYLNPPVKEPS